MHYLTTTVKLEDLSSHLDNNSELGWVLNSILPLPPKGASVVYEGMGWQGSSTAGITHSYFLVIMEHVG